MPLRVTRYSPVGLGNSYDHPFEGLLHGAGRVRDTQSIFIAVQHQKLWTNQKNAVCLMFFQELSARMCFVTLGWFLFFGYSPENVTYPVKIDGYSSSDESFPLKMVPFPADIRECLGVYNINHFEKETNM